MARRLGEPLYGAQYCVDIKKREIHDLDHEKAICQIDKIIEAGNARPCWSPLSGHREGYADCKCCIGVLKDFCEDVSEVRHR